jgi:ubiquinone/menaquinone biosynthesis C-methylase UbiE
MVGSKGQVIGVDYDEEMIDQANQKADEANVAEWVSHKHLDATSLPFENDYFDSSRSDRVFQHLLQPKQVLSEMIRVTKSGGWVVIVDPDHGTISIDTPEVDLEQRLLRVRAEKVFNNGFAGRQLYRQFKQQGLQDISIQLFGLPMTDNTIIRQAGLADRVEKVALETGVITPEELERWRMSLEQADEEGVCFASVTLVMVAGRKP